MKNGPIWAWWMWLPVLAVFAVALGARGWYLKTCAADGSQQAAFFVQGDWPLSAYPEGTSFRGRMPPSEMDNLVANMADHWELRCLAPLSDDLDGELTAHMAPGFPFLHGTLASYFASADTIVRWLNCVLGSLAAACYFFVARRMFHNVLAAFLSGLLIAVHPFWIINTAELNDGVLASFLVGVSLMFGVRGVQTGGAFTGFLFGLSLAGLVMVRAALLPFGVVALLAYLWECRRFSLGWFGGFLAVLAFANGIVPWGIRNYQRYERPVPVVTSTYLHLWMGNNKLATGAVMDEASLRASLKEERLQEMLQEPNQARRYQMLSHDVWDEVQAHPAESVMRRSETGLAFVFGQRWLTSRSLVALKKEGEEVVAPPDWLRENAELILQATMLLMLILAGLGWRWSQPSRRHGRLVAIAAVWIPLPYLLSHAEHLSGPRLPLDGVLLCYAAFALASFIPGLVRWPKAEAKKEA